MINYKQYLVIFGFVTLAVANTLLALKSESEGEVYYDYSDSPSVLKINFEKIQYFALDKNQPKLEFKANTLQMNDLFGANFETISGNVKDEKGLWIRFEADKGNYWKKKFHLKLVDNVSFVQKESDFKADVVDYYFDEDILKAQGNVNAVLLIKENKEKVLLSSHKLRSYQKRGVSIFEGEVKGVIKRDRLYEGVVKFSSQKMEFNRNDLELTLENDVNIDRHSYHIEARRGNIYLENFNKKLKYYTLSDDIKITETFVLKDGKSSKRKAFAERLEGNVSQGKMILLGTPRVEQGSDVIKGYQITLTEGTYIVEVDDSQSSFKLPNNK